MKGLQRRSDFLPENHIALLSNFTAKGLKDSQFSMFLSIENPSERCGASPRRKLKSCSFLTAKMRRQAAGRFLAGTYESCYAS